MYRIVLGNIKSYKVKTLIIYIADRKASAYSCRFFCSACFELRSTTTGTLLLIRRPLRVSGRKPALSDQSRNFMHIQLHATPSTNETQQFTIGTGNIWSCVTSQLMCRLLSSYITTWPYLTTFLKSSFLTKNIDFCPCITKLSLGMPLYRKNPNSQKHADMTS